MRTHCCTPSPVTPSPVTPSPVTPSPVTPSPVTPSPVTPSPVTSSPVTSSPVTPSPVTPSPVTSSPVTSSPVTSSPVTSSPVTSSPVTSSPVTSSPVTSQQNDRLTNSLLLAMESSPKTNRYLYILPYGVMVPSSNKFKKNVFPSIAKNVHNQKWKKRSSNLNQIPVATTNSWTGTIISLNWPLLVSLQPYPLRRQLQ